MNKLLLAVHKAEDLKKYIEELCREEERDNFRLELNAMADLAVQIIARLIDVYEKKL